MECTCLCEEGLRRDLTDSQSVVHRDLVLDRMVNHRRADLGQALDRKGDTVEDLRNQVHSIREEDLRGHRDHRGSMGRLVKGKCVNLLQLMADMGLDLDPDPDPDLEDHLWGQLQWAGCVDLHRNTLSKIRDLSTWRIFPRASTTTCRTSEGNSSRPLHPFPVERSDWPSPMVNMRMMKPTITQLADCPFSPRQAKDSAVAKRTCTHLLASNGEEGPQSCQLEVVVDRRRERDRQSPRDDSRTATMRMSLLSLTTSHRYRPHPRTHLPLCPAQAISLHLAPAPGVRHLYPMI